MNLTTRFALAAVSLMVVACEKTAEQQPQVNIIGAAEDAKAKVEASRKELLEKSKEADGTLMANRGLENRVRVGLRHLVGNGAF